MPQPFAPQGQQKQYTEKPLKVFGEQFHDGGPIPIGVLTTTPTGETTPPYLVTADGIYHPVHDTDWVISNRYSGAVIELLSAEEFSERFGGGAEA